MMAELKEEGKISRSYKTVVISSDSAVWQKAGGYKDENAGQNGNVRFGRTPFRKTISENKMGL